MSSPLQRFAARYTINRQLSRGNLRYTATRFTRLCGSYDVRDLSLALIEEYRQKCLAVGLARKTIESSIVDLRTMYRAATNCDLPVGDRLRVPRPEPRPVPLENLSAIYAASPQWLRVWIVVAFWTCLRLADSLRFLRNRPTPIRHVIRWQAGKTRRNHMYPVPRWFARHLAMPCPIPTGAVTDHLQRVTRQTLTAACRAANVERITPQQIRQRGLTEWTRSNATAGQLIHGCGFGVLNHYVEPIAVIEAAAPRVRLPESFCTVDDREDVADFAEILSRLDPEAQSLVFQTARRLL